MAAAPGSDPSSSSPQTATPEPRTVPRRLNSLSWSLAHRYLVRLLPQTGGCVPPPHTVATVGVENDEAVPAGKPEQS
ncbi:hypothetical protein PAL_GLEAN10005731 [Pteropus alecto]|uniref:Uncharacterized protein n=1 Tax=Pteropus alecto TaxID=9402 RepID=L5KW80_PTEAL|nr:hypothetical protein PAL_GLEAN10005731 [Pteropus alecto]